MTLIIGEAFMPQKSQIETDVCIIGGGFAGLNDEVITNCYSTGIVTGTGANIGGFIGRNNDTCSDNYWDTQTSGQGSSVCATSKTTAEMQTQTTFTGWNFTTIWNINEGTSYPFLR